MVSTMKLLTMVLRILKVQIIYECVITKREDK